ncbi:thiol reductant ABC exporter subunit CydC [Gordonia rubripertincta]|uniref:Thiol reductant ABC exporter subunit CydC n=1 Tax=Gordonia rubripertincta TaxID=36822 RepID=A0ABT4N2L9_GORRU|nr:thiol reductant ABC exporter subunit CydC [Gordonia rubripertincta]MCZ4553210.1 thiol reductant ABC exporter subunit CydC [Gordonia rubripertincta]
MRERLRGDPLWSALGLLGLRGKPVAKSLGLGVLGAGSALALAALSAWLITRAWQMPPVLYLSVAVTAVRALGISRGLFRYLERLATHDLALDAMSTARRRLYLALAGGPAGYSVSLRRGELLARTGSDVDEIGNAVIRALIPIGVSFVVSGAAVAVMAIVSWWAALALALCLAVSAMLAPWLAARGAARATHEGAAAQQRSAEAVMTLLDHAPELAVARRQQGVLADARSAELDAERAADQGAAQGAWGTAALPLAVGISVIVAAMVGIGLANEVSPMALGVLILLPLSAFESTGVMTEAALQLQRSRGAARRIMAMVDRSDDYRAVQRRVSADLGPGEMRVRGLRWGWPGGAEFGGAVGLDLDVAPGTRIAVVGPSGCGKSTLLLTLAGLLEPLAGSVEHTEDDESLVRYFAEDGHIFVTSVRENLLVSRGDASEDELTSAIERVGLTGWVRGLPDGLDTELTAGADSISGGQRRRLLLARALINAAPILLIDEPAENLDRDDAAILQTQLLDADGRTLEPERAMVMVTHQLPRDHRADLVVDLSSFSPAEKAVAESWNRE